MCQMRYFGRAFFALCNLKLTENHWTVLKLVPSKEDENWGNGLQDKYIYDDGNIDVMTCPGGVTLS